MSTSTVVSLRLATDTKISGVSVGVSDRFFRHRHQNIFFCVLKEENANKVGFRAQKYFRSLKILASVAGFPTVKMLVVGFGVGLGVKTSQLWLYQLYASSLN
jgi:hypothetical protein